MTISTQSASADTAKFSAIKAKAVPKSTEDNATKPKRYGHARCRVPRIPIDMPGYYGTGEVLSITNWSPAKLFNKIRLGSFPAPLKDGNRNVWKTSVLREHLCL